MEDLSHLHESARPVARLPAAERLARARADRWIGYTRATQALDQLHTLLDWPAKQRMPNLLVIGPINNGKSMIVEKFRRSHPPISHPDREEIPVLGVQMPSNPHVARFYTAPLSALGAPLRPRQRLAELEQLAVRLLRQAGARMLVIDDLHNVLAGRDGARREFLNLLRFLGNELKIPLVRAVDDGDAGLLRAVLASRRRRAPRRQRLTTPASRRQPGLGSSPAPNRPTPRAVRDAGLDASPGAVIASGMVDHMIFGDSAVFWAVKRARRPLTGPDHTSGLRHASWPRSRRWRREGFPGRPPHTRGSDHPAPSRPPSRRPCRHQRSAGHRLHPR